MSQDGEQREVFHDPDLEVEIYRLSGVVQHFPNHFHDYYVVGFLEGGNRRLRCRDREYDLSAGDLILFNPKDSHFCAPLGGELLDYRAVNIGPDVLTRAARELTGRDAPPRFSQNVVPNCELTASVRALYDVVRARAPRLEREEALFFLLEQLLLEYAAPEDGGAGERPDGQIQALCDYMEAHCAENISLDQLTAMTTFGKSYLLRTFARQVGVTPYRYLQTIRLSRAKKLLESGVPPVDAAGLAGFSDQSHFTNFFKELIGLTPKQYQRIFTHPKE